MYLLPYCLGFETIKATATVIALGKQARLYQKRKMPLTEIHSLQENSWGVCETHPFLQWFKSKGHLLLLPIAIYI